MLQTSLHHLLRKLFFPRQMRQLLLEKVEFNYLYFSILFVFLCSLSVSHFLFVDNPLLGIRLFFLFYSLGQALLETWGCILIAYLLKRFAPRWLFFTFVACFFGLCVLHFTDFTMLRILDAPVSYLFKFLFFRGMDHLLTALTALNMNMDMIILTISILSLIPMAGLLLYWITNRLAEAKPWLLSFNQITMALITTGISLFFLDLLAHPYLDRKSYNQCQKTLPFGATFLSPLPQYINLQQPLSSLYSEEESKKRLPPLQAKIKPNVYLFVVETLRRDFITEEIAPRLTQFALDHIDIPLSFANANWTALSWFAIFQSHLPYHWTTMRDTWTEGSTPLNLFKQMGYKIRVYSSCDLRYFAMDQLLFGKDRQLAHTVQDYSLNRSLEPCDRDILCFDAFEQDLAAQGGREGNLYLFFLDSTHSEYSFPKDFPLKFHPLAKQIDYLSLTQQGVEPLKNRYRTAVSFVDSLMDRFFQKLQQEALYDEAVIAITGDHGEEFYEEKSFFHGTHLNRYQTEVPIFYKLPGATALAKETTHVDLFPSLLHYLTGTSDFHDLFYGRSILAPPHNPHRIAVMQNGSDTPVEFSIVKEGNSLQLRCPYPGNIYKQTQFEVISLHRSRNFSEDSVSNAIESAFQDSFYRLSQLPNSPPPENR
ncbi:MAG: sulfatase-like hydrolase/transferase [Chlamydiia bacterium]|nr:sulfatase-like hydrolase/transferase [Chlamydiia bacterium]